MPTIAELQINVDSRPIEQGTTALNEFAVAADKANKARQGFGQGGSAPTSVVPPGESEKVKNLSEAIDAQTRKLATLTEQRRKLEGSSLKSTDPSEYNRLNNIIDANIEKVKRQGTAVEQLSAIQERESRKKESAVIAELKAQERLTAAADKQVAAVSTAAARQQTSIDATISGLSRQIKAQQDYNKTIEELNRTRALSGISGPDDQRPSLSSAEYDTYVKLAQARRDAALAAEDNTKAIASQQSKLDSITATLGKVEREEVRYSKAVKVLDESLSLGIISLDQYDTKLASFANKRDTAIRAANDNTIAEQRFESQLRSVVSAYDPVQRAQDNYNQSVGILAKGLQEGKISAEAFNRALTQQREALDGVKASQNGTANISNEYQQALNAVLPYRTELQNLERQQRALDSAKAAGKVQTAQEIKDYDAATAAIKRQTAEYNRRIEAGAKAGNTLKQDQQALRGLPAQFTDIVVSLQGGQAPLTVLLQQGGQIKDQFGGVIEAVKGVATGLLGLITPGTAAAAAIALIGYNAYQGSQEVNEFNKALAQSGGASGVSENQFVRLRDTLGVTTGNIGAAAEALTEIERSGKIAGESFDTVALAAISFNKATGQAIKETVDDFASLAKDPVNAVVTLDDKYKFLTASVLAQIDALQRNGDTAGAVALAQDTLAVAVQESADKILPNLGYVDQAWKAIKESVLGVGDAIAGLGRLAAPQDELRQLTELNEKQALQYRGSGRDPNEDPIIKANNERIKQLRYLISLQDFGAKQEAEAEQQRQKAVLAQNRQIAGARSVESPVERARRELDQAQKDQKTVVDNAAKTGQEVTTEQLQNYLKYETTLKTRLNEAIESEKNKNNPKGAPVDSRQVQEVKSNLDLITNEYDNYYKKVTALGKNNVVSEAATIASQKAILEAQKNATLASYDQQIEAIKTLQANKKNSSAQNISLDNQLTKAETARLKASQDFTSKQEQLDERQIALTEKKRASIEAYQEALRQQVDNVVTSGDRAVAAVGRGDRQGNVNEQLAEVDRQFARDQLSLEKQLSKGLDPDEYTRKLALLKDTHTELTETIISNDERLKVSQADWTNGLTRALENLEDSANNVAAAVDKGLTGAFNSAGDALGQFVVTGKLNFRDFATSVIADMAKIAAQQAASQALSGLFNLAFSVGSAYFGGTGANGFAAGSAGAQSSALGASSAGYSSQYFPTTQAKGGGWEGGTQFFAQGGAFTNSIVSTPTAFGMSGNKRGVMGEAGPEAIVPLARASDGSLGVRMVGAGAPSTSGGVNVYVTISDSGTSTTTDAPAAQQFGQELGQFVETKYRQLLARDLADGGAIKQSIKTG